MPAAYSSLKKEHFPLFTTIQKLIYMLDASLPNSFFTRDSNDNIIGMDSQLGWHSECGGEASQGAMMINTHHRTTIDYDAQIQRFGEKVIQMEDEQADQANAYEVEDLNNEDPMESRRQDELNRHNQLHIAQYPSKEGKKLGKRQQKILQKAEMNL